MLPLLSALMTANGTPSECIDRLLAIIMEGGIGGLWDAFRKDPIDILGCVWTIFAALIKKIDGEDTEPVFASAEFEDKCIELATALELPAATGEQRGVIINILVMKLWDLLGEMIKEWLDDQLS